MALRVPLTADPTLQVEFHEIERRLRKLETSVLGSERGSIKTLIQSTVASNTVDLSGITYRLTLLEAALANLTDPEEAIFSVFGPVGSGAFQGLVPSPGTAEPPTGVAEHVLKEDASWGFPLRGLIGVTTDGETDAADGVNVLGGLHVAGKISAADVTVMDMTVLGTLTPQGFLACCEDELTLSGLR